MDAVFLADPRSSRLARSMQASFTITTAVLSHILKTTSTVSVEDGYRSDDWPSMPDGTEWDGKNLFELLREGKSPLKHVWDANLLLQEVETRFQAQVVDIPQVHYGANNYVSSSHAVDVVMDLLPVLTKSIENRVSTSDCPTTET